MTCTHLTTDEIVMIESYFNIEEPVTLAAHVAQRLNRYKQSTIMFIHFSNKERILSIITDNTIRTNLNVDDILPFYPWKTNLSHNDP